MIQKKTWLLIGAGLILVLSFFINDSVRNTISRRRAIRMAEAELTHLSQETDQARQKINNLESNPKSMERIVRKELGYLKPGEKEVRFK